MRTMAVLESLCDQAEGLTLSDLVRRTGLALNTVQRTALTLVDLGYLSRDPASKVFRVTTRVLAFARPFTAGVLMDHALGPMRVLRDTTRETALIGTLTEGAGVILEQIPSLHMFKFTAEIGRLLPLHAAAPCKAMLAFLSEAECRQRLAGYTFTRFNQRTITGLKPLLDHLAEIRRTGFAPDRSEEIEGVHCLAAPVFDRSGRPVASLWITGQSEHLSGRCEAGLATQVMAQAAEISRRLGAPSSSKGVSP